MQTMLHSAFSVGASTIFASFVAESVTTSAPFAVLLVVIGAAIPSLTAIYVASKNRERATDDAQAMLDKAAAEAVAVVEKATQEVRELLAQQAKERTHG